MKKDQRVVQDIETCLEEFDTKPFEASKLVLGTLQSPVVASDKLTTDLNKAIGDGDEQKLSFPNK